MSVLAELIEGARGLRQSGMFRRPGRESPTLVPGEGAGDDVVIMTEQSIRYETVQMPAGVQRAADAGRQAYLEILQGLQAGRTPHELATRLVTRSGRRRYRLTSHATTAWWSKPARNTLSAALARW